MKDNTGRQFIIKLQRLVKSELSGVYRSIYKGEGVEYDRIREYQPWDDFKFIEWNTSSRFGRFFVKEFVEERNIPIYIAIDISSSVFTELTGKSKIEISAEISAILSSIALYNNDLVSLVLFSEDIDYYSPLKRDKNMVMRNYLKVFNSKISKQKKTNFEKLFVFLESNIKKRALIFIISDFLPFETDDRIFSLNKKNEIFFVLIKDPVEENPPPKGVYRFVDPENHSVKKVDFQEKKVLYQYKNLYTVKIKRFVKTMKSKEINIIEIMTTSNPYIELLEYFKKKSKKRKV